MGNFGNEKLMDPAVADSVDFMVERVNSNLLTLCVQCVTEILFSWKVFRNRNSPPD